MLIKRDRYTVKAILQAEVGQVQGLKKFKISFQNKRLRKESGVKAENKKEWMETNFNKHIFTSSGRQKNGWW